MIIHLKGKMAMRKLLYISTFIAIACIVLLITFVAQKALAQPAGSESPQEVFTTILPVVHKNYSAILTGKIVFASYREGNDDIYSMNVDGSNLTRLTIDPGTDNAPDWSPDGTKIAFQSNRSGENEIYVMNANGTNQIQLTTLGHCFLPQWSPDGTRIAFYTRPASDNIIYTMDPDGTDLFQVTDPEMSGYDPDWSPDGLRLAFFSSRTIPGIYVIDADGTDQSLLLAGGDIGYFSWSPTGQSLALSKSVQPNYNFDLFLYHFDSGITTRLTDTTSNYLQVSWSPDGDRLIFHSDQYNDNYEIFILSVGFRNNVLQRS
jgi:Tol biopolymer transport system component